MMDWHQAIHDFWEASCETAWLSTDDSGNITFTADVSIKTDRASCRETTEVRIFRSGREDGIIRLEEYGELTLSRFHTEYKPITPSTCSYRKSKNSLTISGSSPKCGRYEVNIVPVDA